MKKTFFVVSAVVSLLLSHAGPASAQIRWGRGNVPRAGACFYENSDFRGRYFCAGPGETLASLPGGMGDEISSVRISAARASPSSAIAISGAPPPDSAGRSTT